MDILERAGNFFTGGGWTNNSERSKAEAERKKREEEERKRREAAAKDLAKKQTKAPVQQVAFMNTVKKVVKPELSKPTLVAPRALEVPKAPQADPSLKGLTNEDANTVKALRAKGTAPEKVEPLIKQFRETKKTKDEAAYEQSVPGKVLNTIGQVGKTLVGGAVDVGSRVVETVDQSATAIRQAADKLNPTLTDEDKAIRTRLDAQRLKGYQGFRDWLDKSDFADTKETDEQAARISSGKGTPADYVFGYLKALDPTGFIPVGKLLSTATREGEVLFDDIVKIFEKDTGRAASDTEKDVLKEELSGQIQDLNKANTVEDGAEIATEAPKPTDTPSKAPTVDTAAPEVKDVATSYQKVYNMIVADKNLTPEQQSEFIQEARNRHKELLKQVDQKTEQSKAVQEQVVQQANDVAEVQAQQQADAIAELQAKQTEETAPINIGQEATTSDEAVYNDGYSSFEKTSDNMTAARQAEEDRYRQNPLTRVWNALQRIPDSNAQLQRADNALMKEQGVSYKEGLNPNQDLTRLAQLWQRGNQTTAVEKVNRRYAIQQVEQPDGSIRIMAVPSEDRGARSLADVLKERTGLGGRNSKSQQKADDFENYTIQKRAMEVIQKDRYDPITGENNVDNLARLEQQYANNTKAYESQDPNALRDLLTLRAVAKSEAEDGLRSGALTPEQFAGLEKYEYYVPFQRTEAEDLIRPEIKGGMASGLGKQRIVQSMEPGANTPISATPANMLDYIRDSQKQNASQNMAAEIIRRGREGLYLPGKQEANRVVVDGRMLAERADALRESGRIGDEIKALLKESRKAKADKKVIKAEIDGRLRQGIEIMRAYFRDQAANPAASAAAARMSNEELADIFRIAVDAGEVRGKSILKSIEKREGIEGQLQGAIAAMKEDIGNLKLNKAEEYQRAVENRQRVELGRNYISLQENGFTTKMEVSPTLMRQLESLKKQSEPATNVFAKSVNFINNAIKTTYTALNPVFRLVNDFVKNPALMIRNGDIRNIFESQGWKQFAISMASAVNQSKNKFRQEALKEGLSLETLMQTRDFAKQTARDYAARQNVFQFFNRRPDHTIKDVGNVLNRFFATVGNAQREAVAAAEFARNVRNGMPEQQAMRAGVRAANDILGDMNRVNDNVRYLEGISAWLNPTIAGVRALGTAYKYNPVQTAIKDATVLTGLGIIAYNTFNDDGVAREYYERSLSEDRQYQIENSINFFLPGAYIDKETGEAHGVVKVPIPPDFRALWRGIQDEMYSVTNGDGIDPAKALETIARTATGDIARQAVYDPQSANNDALGGWFPTFFGARSGLAAIGVNPNAQGELLDPDNQGATENTSPIAVRLGEMLGVDPVRTDAILRELGFAGTVARTGDPVESLFKGLTNQFTGGKFDKPGATYFKEMKETAKSIGDLKQRRIFESLHQKRTTGAQLAKELGMEVPEGQANTGMLDSAFKALALLSNEEVLNAELALSDSAIARGEAVNPLFDRNALTPEQRNAILTYRQGKIYNSAGQNKDANSETAFTALGLDEPWYEEFRQKENDFFNSLGDGTSSEDTIRTFSGDTKEKATPELQAKLDYYYTLAKGTGDRSRFLRANPDVLDYWQKSEDFTNAERAALGFKPIADEEQTSGGGGGGSTYGILGEILNLGNDPGRATLVTDKPYEAIDSQLSASLKRLFGSQRGGRVDVPIGGQSRGDV